VVKGTNQQELMILSHKSGENPAAIVHFMKFYNLIEWQGRVNINKKYSQMRRPFRFR
jgi:hypothetical protein